MLAVTYGLAFNRLWHLAQTNAHSSSPELSSRIENTQIPNLGHCAAGASTCGAQKPPPSGWLSSAQGLWCPCRLWGRAEGRHPGNASAPPKDEMFGGKEKKEGNNSDNAEVYQFHYICFNMAAFCTCIDLSMSCLLSNGLRSFGM